jgi:N-acetylmuramoyl-L-alanine amidase
MRSTAIRASAIALALVTAVAATVLSQSADPGGAVQGSRRARDGAAPRARRDQVGRTGRDAAPRAHARRVVRRSGAPFPHAGQADKALWQGASLSADLFFQAGDEVDRDRAQELLASLSKTYPGGSYARQGAALARRLGGAPRVAPTAVAAVSTPAPKAVPRAATARATTAPETALTIVALTAVRRELLPEAVRVTLELEREVAYHTERIQGPDRVFVDLPRTRAVQSLRFAVLPFDDDVVRRVRVGAHPDGSTRVVLDLEGAGRHSIYTLYNPHRIVVDVERRVSSPLSSAPAHAPAPRPMPTAAAAPPPTPTPPPPLVRTEPPVTPALTPPVVELTSAASAIVAAGPPLASPPPAAAPAPAAPAVNARGGFSLSRQLGLGIARIVIDAGHGGHDPAPRSKG